MRIRNLLAALLFCSSLALTASPASAQATRTWVSGVGDDVNPCSRTAPCKTFAGAISKTAPGGEINCLDPGGFGAVTITKSITIDCHHTEGGALAGGNGVVVNAAATDVVVLRGLDIYGVTPPTHGVRVIAAGAVIIEDCVIRRFNSANSFGVSFQPSGSTRLYISNTAITQNGNGATGGGILIQPTGASGTARVTLNNVRVQQNANDGLRVNTAGNTGAAGIGVAIEGSEFSGTAQGISVTAAPGTTIALVTVNGSLVAHNTGTGILGDGANVLLRAATNTITGNARGVNALNGASVGTFGNNRLTGNPTTGGANDGSFTGSVIPGS
jgi:hypothetical protein